MYSSTTFKLKLGKGRTIESRVDREPPNLAERYRPVVPSHVLHVLDVDHIKPYRAETG